MVEDLEIEEAHVVTGGPGRRRHPLEAERLEPQIDLGVHERTGMDEEDTHGRYCNLPSPAT